jgi:hypothetical protein
MSKPIFEGTRLLVTSYCGPANTVERTRMRLQFDLVGADISTLGFNDVRALSMALDRWLVENDKEPKQ